MISRLCAIVVAVGLLTGCGGPKLVPVEGTVTLDGSPLVYKSLFFAPEPGTPGKGAGGYTQRDGKYSLLAVVPGATVDHEGIMPGRYRVTIFEPMIPITDADFGPWETEDKGNEPGPASVFAAPGLRPQQTIPAVYTSAQTTPMVLEVPENGGVLNLELTSNTGPT